MVGNVERKSLLQEPEADVVLADCVQDEADVGVNQGKLRMVLSRHKESQVSGSK